ncbi:hypothetical protein PENPOL_c002G07307 [Penicillium polonicum]|uniref:Cytochrome P450 monooxygenase verH n=1 Tax=Penicillium polonicum TaxID=60169 RepID=VERH_PENPO|nr:RecName: Full=Cytochrome P450 monooxygenase verH; AltName: Full=Cluster 4 protein H; AltName: Full=Verrucosidin biosynthesis cluster protein H [Penicillium polonicum]OQD69071.1 hypothetical protein PENPOL_c002G07307 [Penicillium polonicum]
MVFAMLVVCWSIFLGLWMLVSRLKQSRDKICPPKGPPRLPWIGNLHQFPLKLLHLRLTEWSRTYGGFYTLKLGPVTAAVITDRQIAKEAFDRNSAISSTRHTNYATEFVTDGTHLLTMKYGALWREERKILQQTLKGSVCDNDHMRLIDAEQTQLMRDLLVNPSDYSAYIKRASTSIITSLVFGIRTPSCATLHLQELDAINDDWLQLLVIGGALSEDVFPVLKYIPSAFLGTFTKRLKGIRRRMRRLYGTMLNQTITRQRESPAPPARSMIDAVLNQREHFNLTDRQIEVLAGVTLEGGFDTTTSMLLVFVQAMTLHPECQERAYVEINALCGRHRIPQWSDRNQLPYVNMLLKETMRWRPVTTLSPPHVLEKDTTIRGTFLPQGSMLILNTWGLHQDPNVFIDPDRFDPMRYEGYTKLAADYANAPDAATRDHYTYGIGRRICPGIHLADRSMFLAIAKLIWGFRFEPQRDEQGNSIPIDSNPVTGYTVDKVQISPKPFACAVIPRDKEGEKTILREFGVASEVFADYNLDENASL